MSAVNSVIAERQILFYNLLKYLCFNYCVCCSLNVEHKPQWWKGYAVQWYLLKTKPNAHSTACKHLRRQGFDVFLPMVIKTTKRNVKFLDAKVPLFPGYLFIGTSMDPVPWKSVNGTRGISTAVTLDGVYRPVNSDIIEGLKCRCDDDGVIKMMNDIIPGDRVKIERGPFAGFICTVDDIQDNWRAWVLIDLLHQKTRSEISLNSLSGLN